MNVTCTGCPAKYAVPDEKVRGKKVRITCKHCGTHIVVDGTAVDTSDAALPKAAAPVASSPAAAAPPVSAPEAAPAPAKATVEPKQPVATKPAAPAEVIYIVGFADDRQHPHTIAQIVELYSAGKIDDEALVWKDGMADWLSPFDVPELAAAFRAKNVAPRAAAAAPAAPAPAAPAPAPAPAFTFSGITEDEATLVVRSPFEDGVVTSAPAVPAPAPAFVPAPATAAAVSPKPAEPSELAKPGAARRVEKRGGADLFGNVGEAGSEGDVSLDLASDEPAQKLTGARNESSVLFSLDALTKSDAKTSKAREKEKEKDDDASAALFGESAPDPLLNLGGGGLGAMAAPDFTLPVAKGVKPIASSAALDVPDGASHKGRGGALLLVGFLGIAAAAAVAFVMMKKQPPTDTASIAPSATTQTITSAAPAAPTEPTASSAPAASDAPAASNAPAAGSAPAASASATANASATASAAPPAGSAAAVSAANAKPAGATTPATPAAANKPAEAAEAKPPEAAAPPPEGAAFDKNAAVAALGTAAASAASCKQADGPTGSGKVSVTFAPSGRATATSVAGELAGTEVGGCVARLFRAAKVPPFSGEPVTVSKSFTIQ